MRSNAGCSDPEPGGTARQSAVRRYSGALRPDAPPGRDATLPAVPAAPVSGREPGAPAMGQAVPDGSRRGRTETRARPRPRAGWPCRWDTDPAPAPRREPGRARPATHEGSKAIRQRPATAGTMKAGNALALALHAPAPGLPGRGRSAMSRRPTLPVPGVCAGCAPVRTTACATAARPGSATALAPRPGATVGRPHRRTPGPWKRCRGR